jgi:hypothetical protein
MQQITSAVPGPLLAQNLGANVRFPPWADVDQAAKAMRDEEMQAEIEDFLEGFNQPTYRGMRISGQRVAT